MVGARRLGLVPEEWEQKGGQHARGGELWHHLESYSLIQGKWIYIAGVVSTLTVLNRTYADTCSMCADWLWYASINGCLTVLECLTLVVGKYVRFDANASGLMPLGCVNPVNSSDTGIR